MLCLTRPWGALMANVEQSRLQSQFLLLAPWLDSKLMTAVNQAVLHLACYHAADCPSEFKSQQVAPVSYPWDTKSLFLWVLGFAGHLLTCGITCLSEWEQQDPRSGHTHTLTPGSHKNSSWQTHTLTLPQCHVRLWTDGAEEEKEQLWRFPCPVVCLLWTNMAANRILMYQYQPLNMKILDPAPWNYGTTSNIYLFLNVTTLATSLTNITT